MNILIDEYSNGYDDAGNMYDPDTGLMIRTAADIEGGKRIRDASLQEFVRRKEQEKENQPVRRADQGNSSATAPARKKRAHAEVDSEGGNGPDPYFTLPEPSGKFVQLRFQLVHFNGVYRIVRVPLSYTFANLYTLILYLFGWSGMHLHQFEVFSDVELYSGNYKKGHIKKAGCIPDPPEDATEHELMYWDIMGRPQALYQLGTRRSKKVRPSCFDFDSVPRLADEEMTIGEVWNRKLRKNASKGRCTNMEMGVKFLYDFGDEWHVDITAESEECFWKYGAPSNLPDVITAKGAPPVEDAGQILPGELDGRKKDVDFKLFDRRTFERYCKGELSSVMNKHALVICETNAPSH